MKTLSSFSSFGLLRQERLPQRDHYQSRPRRLRATRFVIHFEIVRKNSSLIAPATSLPDRVSTSNANIIPEAFLSFVHFCYEHTTVSDIDAAETDLDPASTYIKLIELHRLAGFLGSTTLANHCLDRIVTVYEESDEAPGTEAVVAAWTDNRTEQAQGGTKGFKRLLTDWWVVAKTDVMDEHAVLPNEIVALCYVDKGIEGMTSTNAAEYHVLEVEVSDYDAVEADDGDEELVMVDEE